MDFENNLEEQQEIIGGTCCVCGQHEINSSENSISLLCMDCQKKYSRFSVPKWIKYFMAALLLITVLMLMQMPSVIGLYEVYRDAERSRNAREYIPASLGYMSVLENYSGSVSIIMNALDSSIGAQNFDYAAYIFEEYLVGKKLTDEQYEQAMGIMAFLDSHYNTQELIQEVLNDHGEDTEGAKNALRELIKNSDIDKSLVYFVLANITEDNQARMEYMLLSTKQNELCTYAIAYYGNELRRVGKYDEALNTYNYALSRNASDTYAMRGAGIVMQLMGDIAGGLQIIRKAYDIDPEGRYIKEAIIIALCENAMREEAMTILESSLAGGYVFGQDLYDYLDGKTTMVKYYTE